MDFEGQAYRLVCTLPILGVMTVGVFLAFLHRWRNPRVCTLVGIALLLAMGVYVFFPIVSSLAMKYLVDPNMMAEGGRHIVSLVHTLVYSTASAVVWGLVLFAIFGRGGVVDSQPEPDDDYE